MHIRLALIGPYPTDPSYIPGGVAAVTFYLVQALRQLTDLDVHVVSTVKGSVNDRFVEDGNVHLHYLGEPRRRIVPNLLKNIGRIRSEIELIAPDIVHSESPIGTLAGTAAGYPTVHTIHGISHREVKYARTPPRKLAVWLEGWLCKKAVSRVKHCIATSSYAAREYAPYSSAKMHAIFNPVEDRFFGLNVPTVDLTILTASYVTRLKNTLGLVKAFELVHRRDPRPRLLVCGKNVDPAYHGLVEQYVRTHGLEEAVQLLGFISQEELVNHFSKAAIICLFSHQESSPMVVAQAMCAGKPVVASAVGGTVDLVLDQETGFLVADGDESAFAERTLQLLTDPSLHKRMGKRAREVAEERFRKEIVAVKTVEVYSEVLNP